MPLAITQPVNDPNLLRHADAYGTSAKIRWESSSDTLTWLEIGTSDIVADTAFYTFIDPDGTDSTYYRTRYSIGSPSVLNDYSEYSTSFRGGSLTAYASLEDFVERLVLPDTSRYNLLADLLAASARYLDARITFDFLRHPQVSGTEARTFDVPDSGRRRFPIVGGIVSITTLEIASSTGAAFTTLSASDYYLWPRQLEPEGTYTHVVLLETAATSTFPAGQGVLRITGAFGWATPPTIIVEANHAHAARSYHEWQTRHAGPVGNPEFGTIPLSPNLPDVVYQAIKAYRYYWVDM